MGERKYDQSLSIRTTGLREWRDANVPYNRYEATPYKALDQLFSKYKLTDQDRLVDFGCGRGRVVFYIHRKFQIPVTGVELHEQTLEEAFQNKYNYRQKANHISAPIQFEYGLAEQYEIKPEENRFYFFNPFSVYIFKQVVNNIMKSVERHPRVVDIILYYPLGEYKHFLHDRTPFRLMNKVKVAGAKDPKEKFLIYRLDEHDPADNDIIFK